MPVHQRSDSQSSSAGTGICPGYFIKDVDDFTAKELSIIENWHREDLNDVEKEKFINELWRNGVKDGKYTSYKDMERKTGIGAKTIAFMIGAFDDRNSLKKAKRFILS